MKTRTSKWMGALLLATAAGLAVPSAFSKDAGQGGHDHGSWKQHCRHGDMSDWKQRFEQRKAALHDKLKLTAQQEAAWTTFTAKVQPPAMQPPDWKALAQMSAPNRMQAMLDRIKARVDSMSSNLTAVKEFYAALTTDQQKVFDSEFMPAGRHHHNPPEADNP